MLQNLLLKVTFHIAKIVGKFHAPFTHKNIKAQDYHEVAAKARPGDVLLSRIEGELSNLFIPGKWTHAAIYSTNEKPTVVEAIGAGTKETDLIDFMLKKDAIVLLRPLFATEAQANLAAQNAEEMVGTPYDYELRSDNKALYCSELVWYSYHKIFADQFPFRMRERLGQMTVTPDDFFMAADKWNEVWP